MIAADIISAAAVKIIGNIAFDEKRGFIDLTSGSGFGIFNISYFPFYFNTVRVPFCKIIVNTAFRKKLPFQKVPFPKVF